MLYLFAATISLALTGLALSVIALTLRDSGFAILAALAGTPPSVMAQPALRMRRPVRFRAPPVALTPLRAAA